MRVKTASLKTRLRQGGVYRRKDLARHSASVDRELQTLVRSGVLRKASGGLYYRPRLTRFGAVAPDNDKLIAAFLDTDDFLAFSPNDLNGLGLGSTQLSNVIRVYNHKRHDVIQLAGKTFDFRIRDGFPKELSEEFLFVEFLNEHAGMGEEIRLQESLLQAKLERLDRRRLERIIASFGKIHSKKTYAKLTTARAAVSSRSR